MKLKSRYGNIIETTNNERKINHLKTLGYTEVIEEKVQPKQTPRKKKGENK